MEKDFKELRDELKGTNAAKFAIGMLINFGTTAAVMALFRNPVNGLKGITRILAWGGVAVLGWKIGDETEKYLDEQIEELVKTFREARKEMNADGPATA